MNFQMQSIQGIVWIEWDAIQSGCTCTWRCSIGWGGGMLSGWQAESTCTGWQEHSGDRLCQVAIMARCHFPGRTALCVCGGGATHVQIYVYCLWLKMALTRFFFSFFFLHAKNEKLKYGCANCNSSDPQCACFFRQDTSCCCVILLYSSINHQSFFLFTWLATLAPYLTINFDFHCLQKRDVLISHLIPFVWMQFMSCQRVITYYVLDKLICDFHLGRNCIYILQRLGFPFWQTGVNKSDEQWSVTSLLCLYCL